MSYVSHPFIGIQFQTPALKSGFVTAYMSDEPQLKPLLPFDETEEEIHIPRYQISIAEAPMFARYSDFNGLEHEVLERFRAKSPGLRVFPDDFELRHAANVISSGTRRGRGNRLLVGPYGAMRLYAEHGPTQSFVVNRMPRVDQEVWGWDHGGSIPGLGIEVHVSNAIGSDEAFLVYMGNRHDAAAVAYGSIKRPILAFNSLGMAAPENYAFRFQF